MLMSSFPSSQRAGNVEAKRVARGTSGRGSSSSKALAAALGAAALLGAATASACPVCESATGQQVRAGILDGELGLTLMATLLPFAVFSCVTAAIHGGLPRRRAQSNPSRAREPHAR